MTDLIRNVLYRSVPVRTYIVVPYTLLLCSYKVVVFIGQNLTFFYGFYGLVASCCFWPSTPPLWTLVRILAEGALSLLFLPTCYSAVTHSSDLVTACCPKKERGKKSALCPKCLSVHCPVLSRKRVVARWLWLEGHETLVKKKQV